MEVGALDKLVGADISVFQGSLFWPFRSGSNGEVSGSGIFTGPEWVMPLIYPARRSDARLAPSYLSNLQFEICIFQFAIAFCACRSYQCFQRRICSLVVAGDCPGACATSSPTTFGRLISAERTTV